MADTKNVQNQQPNPESSYSESQVEKGNPSNATKQPGGQPNQQGPKKDVQGTEKNKEPQKTGTGKH